jgi:5-methylcytosine-specific restriction endonuclease McrA
VLEDRVSEPSGCKLNASLQPTGDGPTTMNRWNIPDWLEREVIERDRSCVYCGVAFTGGEANPCHRPSWEHITNDVRIITRENIARCCIGCNSSKGRRASSNG